MKGTPMPSEKRIALSIASRLADVALISAAINKLCTLFSLRSKDIFEIEVCVTEAVVNSIRHAYHNQPEHTVTVNFGINSHVVIEVCDSGSRMDPSLLTQMKDKPIDFNPYDIEKIPDSGRGLTIIQSFMDEATYRTIDGINVFTMKKKMKR